LFGTQYTSAVNLRVSLSVTPVHRFNDGNGMLSGGTVVQIDKVALAMNFLVENREIGAEPFGVKVRQIVLVGL
jgi:hypothetical protein